MGAAKAEQPIAPKNLLRLMPGGFLQDFFIYGSPEAFYCGEAKRNVPGSRRVAPLPILDSRLAKAES
jgi:hypothetical protein